MPRRTFMSIPTRDTGLHASRTREEARHGSVGTVVPTATTLRATRTDTGRHLNLIHPAHEEYEHFLAHPALYEFTPEVVEAMREDYLTRHRLIEWECSAGHTVHTPFDLPGAFVCRRCIPHLEVSA